MIVVGSRKCIITKNQTSISKSIPFTCEDILGMIFNMRLPIGMTYFAPTEQGVAIGQSV